MRLVFRADANRELGAGHVMRSLALATEAINRGYTCFFVGEIRDLNWVKKAVNELGFTKVFEKPFFFNPDSETDVLVLDSYNLSPQHPQLQKENWQFVVVIGDAVTPAFKCDLFIHPGIDDHWINDTGKSLVGFDYVMFRPEIQIARDNKSKQNEILNILVSGGGGDAFGFSEVIGRELDKIDLNFVAHFFSSSPVKSLRGKDFRNYPIGSEIDYVRTLANIAITTASTSSLEFIAAEIPTAIVCTVDNQQEYFDELRSRGLALAIGTFSKGDGWVINSNDLQELITSKRKQEDLINAISGKFDFLGPRRIMDYIEKLNGSSVK
jgi:spore coat polysaccharide biosynthesis predicted glycosyltransferase SpsG